MIKKVENAKLLLTLVSLFLSLQGFLYSFNSLSEFEKSLVKRPEKVLQRKSNTLAAVVSKKEFLETMKRCEQCLFNQLKNRDVWLHKPSDNAIGSCPYVQKVVIPAGSAFACWGDLHGSVHSFIRSLKHLCQLGYLQDDFSISPHHQQFYLIFLGDYVDRGCYGIEVLYLLMKLKIANPGRVVIIRGNHENVPANKLWGLGKELQLKYRNFFDIHDLSSFFNYLPLACYVGFCTQNRSRYILCCHGGPDISFDASSLLAASSTSAFQNIQEMPYKSFTEKKINELLRNQAERVELEVEKEKTFKKGIRWVDEKDTSFDAWLMKFGFIWTDFDVYEEHKKLFVFTKRCWLLSKKLTSALLQTNTSAITIDGIMRGHQHHGKLYHDLITHKGFVQSWDGLVNTLFSAPAAKTFSKSAAEEPDFNYDSFVIVQTPNEQSEKWSYNHWWHELGKQSWESLTGTF